MAATEAALVGLLVQGSPNPVADLVGSRIYENNLPQRPTYPAIRYQRIDTVRGPYRKMATGRSRYAKPRFQFVCHATTPAIAQAIGIAVKSILDGFSGTSVGVTIGSVALEDEAAAETEFIGEGGSPIYGWRLDFLIGHVET